MFNMCHSIKISYIPKIYPKVTWQDSSTFSKNNLNRSILIRNEVQLLSNLYYTLQISLKKM